MNSNPDIKVFLIGNKNDLEERRRVQIESAQKIKNDYNIDMFMETSAKSGFNAKELFVEAAKILFTNSKMYHNEEKFDNQSVKSGARSINLEDDPLNDYITNKPNTKNKSCC
jgi:GTPase SAR1 family protein